MVPSFNPAETDDEELALRHPFAGLRAEGWQMIVSVLIQKWSGGIWIGACMLVAMNALAIRGLLYGRVIAKLAQLRGIQPAYSERAGERSPEAFDGPHGAAAAWARGSLVVRYIEILIIIRAPIRWRRRHLEQLAAQRELFGAMAVRQQSVITNPMEAVRQNMKEKAANEFTGLECHDLPGATTILAAEADVVPIHIQQPIVGDRDTMRVARKIGQHALGTGEGPLGIDDPVGPAQWCESGGKCDLVV